MAGKKQLDDYSDIAVTIVQEEANMERLKRRQKETLARVNQYIGRIQATEMVSRMATVSKAMWLKEMKESRDYLSVGDDENGVKDWESFCNHLGISRRKADEDILNLTALGEECLETCSRIGVGYRELRKLRQLTHDGTITLDTNTIEIGGELIPLTLEHKDDLQAALDRAIEEKNRIINEQEKTIRIKERRSEDKEKKIQSLVEDIDRLEVRARTKGISPEEDALQQKIEAFRIQFEGLFVELSALAEAVCTNPTPAVVANFISLMDNSRMRFSGFREDVVAVSPPGMVEDDCFPPGLITES